MSTYTDHHLKHLQYEEVLNIIQPIGFFANEKKAIEYLLMKGKAFTEQFHEEHGQGCAFTIKAMVNADENLIDYLQEEVPSLYWTDKSTSWYVFSEVSYQMCLNEHLIYLSHDWDRSFPGWIKYVLDDGKIQTGCDLQHLQKAHNVFTYRYNDENRKREEFEAVRNYIEDNNPEHLKGLC